jgi:thiamine pyrophosphate-dependent acetolactate synthase large subunit-like protein
MWVQNESNFAKIAEDMGALGIRVERAEDIAEAFQKALKADRPVVIDVVSDINVVAPVAWEAGA